MLSRMNMCWQKQWQMLVLFFVAACKSQELSTKPSSRVMNVALSQKISITCVYQTDKAIIKWTKNGVDVTVVGFKLYTKAFVNDNNQAVSELTAEKQVSTLSDAGQYRCEADGKRVTFQIYIKAQGTDLSVEPPFAVLYIVAPSQINITCIYTSSLSGSINWQIGGSDVTTKGFASNIESTTSDNVKYSEVEAIKDVSSVDDSGEYRCVTNDGTSYPIQVVVFTVNVTEAEYTRGMSSASLACDPNLPLVDNQVPRYTRKWQRDHKDLTGLEDYSTKYELYDNFTLDILNTERADADAYQCCLLFNQSQEVSITVNYYAGPLVKRFDKSKNLIQGDRLELKCAVLGHPIGNITWKKDDVVIEESDRLKFKVYGGLANGVLEIPIIDFDDKGTYMCLATSSKFVSTSNSTIVVRVKDKLAALWPFLGIVAEVIILCIIIFIYEKKRSKDDNSEDDDANVKCGSANATEANEVRQRNVRT